MLRIVDYSNRATHIKKKVQEIFREVNLDFEMREDAADRIRLVFAGQYSAGKSSILKMLTGRSDIAVGAGITTQQVHTYDWNGIEVVDTPGIHTELRPDHDEASYEAIASADILVFVITNELFDSYIAEHFRKLAIDKDKASEMILVVNKMERAAEGNSAAQRAIICDDLRKVLTPYTPEQLSISFLDAESYLDGILEGENDEELADELIVRSGYHEFLETLNRFVATKGLSGKLTTDLYMLDELLGDAIKKLQPKSADADVDALEESFLQQRHVLIEARGRMQQEVRDIYALAATKIRDIGLESANLLVSGCNQEEVEEELEKAIRKVDDIVERCQTEAIVTIDSRLNEIGQRLEAIENSEFSQNLKIRLKGKIHKLPEGVQKFLSDASAAAQKAGQATMNNAYKAGTQGGLKLTNFSQSSIHKVVLKVGKTIGYKFKPWQAVKLTKGIAIGGQVLSVLGVGLSVFMQLKSDYDEELARKDLRENRQNIRSQFNLVANKLEDHGKMFVKEQVNGLLQNSIAELDNGIKEIRESRTNRNLACQQFEALQQDCRMIIRDIHMVPPLKL